jgi:quercetin dioxygenase-like cupin family protein
VITPPAGPDRTDGISGSVLASGILADGIALTAAGAIDVTTRQVTMRPGACTGWHYHPGPVIVTIVEGSVTVILADGTATAFHTGHTFIEHGGAHCIHQGCNLGRDPLRLCATYLLPAGSPWAISTPPPVEDRT